MELFYILDTNLFHKISLEDWPMLVNIMLDIGDFFRYR